MEKHQHEGRWNADCELLIDRAKERKSCKFFIFSFLPSSSFLRLSSTIFNSLQWKFFLISSINLYLFLTLILFLPCLLSVNQLSCRILPPALRTPSTPCISHCQDAYSAKVSAGKSDWHRSTDIICPPMLPLRLGMKKYAFYTCFLHMFLFHNVIYNPIFHSSHEVWAKEVMWRT